MCSHLSASCRKNKLAATTNRVFFLSLHLILHHCFHGSLTVNLYCEQFNAQLLSVQLNHILTVSNSCKSFTHYHLTSVSIFPLHHHELDTRWVYEHLCYDSLIKPVIVAVQFAAVLKRFTVSTAILHRHTVVFPSLLLLFFKMSCLIRKAACEVQLCS